MTELYFWVELTQVKCAQLVVVRVKILWTAEHTFLSFKVYSVKRYWMLFIFIC